MNTIAFRLSALALSLALVGEASALGLGDLRSTPNLGERPHLEVELLGAGREALEPSCFRLRTPVANEDIPWLKRAVFSIRKGGAAPILEIRSEAPLRDPILQVSVHVACGHEIVRDYMILASPERTPILSRGEDQLASAASRQSADYDALSLAQKPAPARPKSVQRRDAPARSIVQRRAEPQVTSGKMADRLMLSAHGDAGEPSLRLATELSVPTMANMQIGEAQREILRLEFRTLLALSEQATTQLEAAQKLRSLEASLSELQKRSSEIAQKAEQGVLASAPPVLSLNPDQPVPPAPGSQEPAPVPPVNTVAPVPVIKPAAPPLPPLTPPVEDSLLSELEMYGLLTAMLLGVAGWLGWRSYRRRTSEKLNEPGFAALALEVDPQRNDERDELGGVDLHVDPVAMGGPMQVDFPLDTDESASGSALPKPVLPPGYDSMMSISAATVDEHFEANPVMELADIMLSFGRVKGAAQALQEYIDHNPQEALQPWIRLMDVYRMAGLREEFDNVARNLNLHFNVEIQQWDPAEPKLNRHTIDMVLDDDQVDTEQQASLAPRAESIEEMPRIMQQTMELWRDGDVLGYLQQLLRDNRGGKRSGFSLNVVEEILFLIDLKEALNKA